MRELLFKSSTSTASKKRDLFVQESFEKDGILARTERHCRYFILGTAHIDDPDDIEKLSSLKMENMPHKKRHYYILKVRDDRLGEDRLVCKIAGTFYAVSGSDIYCIAFVHSFKVAFNLVKKEV